MKKLLLMLSMTVLLAGLGLGVTSAYAQEAPQTPPPPGPRWLLGTVVTTESLAEEGQGLIMLETEDGVEVEVTTTAETSYRTWMRPGRDIGFESLKGGDWVAISVDSELVAKLVILISVPQQPIYLRGKVAEVSDGTIIVTDDDGNGFTLSVPWDTSGVEVGQPVRVIIGEPAASVIPCRLPRVNRMLPELRERLKEWRHNWQGNRPEVEESIRVPQELGAGRRFLHRQRNLVTGDGVNLRIGLGRWFAQD